MWRGDEQTKARVGAASYTALRLPRCKAEQRHDHNVLQQNSQCRARQHVVTIRVQGQDKGFGVSGSGSRSGSWSGSQTEGRRERTFFTSQSSPEISAGLYTSDSRNSSADGSVISTTCDTGAQALGANQTRAPVLTVASRRRMLDRTCAQRQLEAMVGPPTVSRANLPAASPARVLDPSPRTRPAAAAARARASALPAGARQCTQRCWYRMAQGLQCPVITTRLALGSNRCPW